ncbi:MAG: SprT family zinc-dependent metalloprotease [Sphingomonadales bacterium]
MSGLLLEIIDHGGMHWPVQARRRRDVLAPRLTPHARMPCATLWTPPGLAIAEIKHAYDARRAWLLDHIANRRRRRPAIRIGPGISLPFEGRPHCLVSDPGIGRRVEIADGALVIGGPAEHLPQRLSRFLRDQARQRFEAAVRVHAANLQVTPKRLVIRDTSSRWGSCSHDRSLSFSWRPVMAPGFVLDYLAAHEVAHLRHMDHSRAFWSAVAETCPDWALAADYLRLIGLELMRYRLPAAK